MIFGLLLYGKVHRTPSRLFIATRFVHICFVPVAPDQSYILVESKGEPSLGLKIRLDKFSMLVAYLRGLFIGSLFAVPALLFFLVDGGIIRYPFTLQALPWIACAVAWWGLSLVGAIYTYLDPRITKASPSRQAWMERQLQEAQDLSRASEDSQAASNQVLPL